jgi:hypothetical protein
MVKKYKPLLARCCAAAKNSNAGMLLYRINYWMPFAKVTFGGKKFSANSAANWCEETNLTYDQYRRAISHLRKLHFVETEQHLFGRKNITHVRITDLGIQAIQDASPGKGISASAGTSKDATPNDGINAQLNIKGVSSLEVLNGGSTMPLASALGNGHANEKPNEVTGNTEMEKEEPEDLKKLALKSAATSPCSPSDLAELWRVEIQAHCPHYVPPVTSQELAQFKKIIAACPPGFAPTVVTVCIKDWWMFCKSAKASSGAYSLPDLPTVSFLQRWVGSAVNFAQSYEVETSTYTPKSPPPEPAAMKPKAPPKASTDDEKPANKEELFAILNGD